MNRIAIYICETNLKELEHQKAKLIETVKSEVGLVYDLFIETKMTLKSRTAKNQLMKSLAKKEFDAILVYKIAHWGGSIAHFILDAKELIDNNISIYSYEGVALEVQEDNFNLLILSAFVDFLQVNTNVQQRRRSYFPSAGTALMNQANEIKPDRAVGEFLV